MAGRKKAPKPRVDTQSISKGDAVEWVAVRFKDQESIDATREAHAPSEYAWSLFQQYCEDAESRREFFKDFVKPSHTKEKAQVEDSRATTDDQRKFFRIFDQLEIEKPELLNDNFPRRTIPTVIATEGIGASAAESAPVADNGQVECVPLATAGQDQVA